MPIYEFYCENCHAIFKFFSRRVDTDSTPACPDCARPRIERRVSAFSISRGLKENTDLPPDLDEAHLEEAMGRMMQTMEGVGEDDPKGMARTMRTFFDAAGLGMGPAMEEALSRMERGEDPDAIEADMGESLSAEDPFAGGSHAGRLRSISRRLRPPRTDDELHEL